MPPLRARAVPSTTIPPTIRALLLNVLGSQPVPTEEDLGVLDHFINWLATIYHTHSRADTGWIVTGRTFTGKGTLVKEIITPLFGYVRSKEMKHLEGEFNEFLDRTSILVIDEATSDRFKGPKVQAMIRRIITEDLLTITEKFKPQREIPNYINVIMASNEHTPIKVPSDERRWNIAPRQERAFPGNRDELAAIFRAEMPAFAGYLAQYPYDKARAQTVLKTPQRDKMIADSATTAEQFAGAIKGEGSAEQHYYDGDLDYFVDGYWDNVNGTLDSYSQYMVAARQVRSVLVEWAGSANPAGAEQLQSIVVPPAHVAAIYNFFLQDKFEIRPRQIGKILHLNASAAYGPKANRGKGYRIYWHTKKTAKELEAFIEELKGEEQKLFEKLEDSDDKRRTQHQSRSRSRRALHRANGNGANGHDKTRETLIAQLNAVTEDADRLVRAQFTDPEKVARAPEDALLKLGIHPVNVKRLQRAARDWLRSHA
jgi:hypothetical protein